MNCWPGFDEPPVVITAGGRQRVRHGSVAMQPQQAYFTGPNGELLVPAGQRPHRSGSVGGYQQRPPLPAQVIINNDNAVQYDDHSPQQSPRRSSRHGHHHSGRYYYDDYPERSRSRSRTRMMIRDRSRSHSRVRIRERTPSPFHGHDYETEARLRRLEELEKREEADRQKKRIEADMLLEQAKREAKEAARKKEQKEQKERAIDEFNRKEAIRVKEEKELRERAIDDFNRKENARIKEEKEMKEKVIDEYNKKQAEEKAKAKKAEEAAEAAAQETMRKTLRANGYTESEIDAMIRKAEKGDKSKKAHHHHHAGEGSSSSTTVLAASRPTYIKVHSKHLDPETLDLHELPWEWDYVDADYIIIKQWIPEPDQEILFEHTRKLRERSTKMITYDVKTELRKKNDTLQLVRKKETRAKSPARSWIF